jgi:hypothetical protein
MMRKLLVRISAKAAVALLFSGFGAQFASAQQEFRGRGCIVSTNAYCAPRGFKVGDCGDVRFTPPNLFGNGNATKLSFNFQNYAQNYTQPGNAVGLVYKDVEFSWIGRSGGVADQSLTKWRIPLVQPANYSLPYVHMVVDFFRYDDFDPGDRSLCNARWRITAQKWPEPGAASGAAEMRLPALDSGVSPTPLGNTLPRIGN